jgi:biopolymer transport protein ExbD
MKQLWRKPTEYYRKIDVLPFTVVLFVLLIIFLVDTTPSHHHRFVDLVKVRHVIPLPNASREDAMLVGIQRDGQIYFDTMRVNLPDLTKQLRVRAITASEKKVYIQVDARARYDTVKTVLDSVAAAHIQNVSFLTELQR